MKKENHQGLLKLGWFAIFFVSTVALSIPVHANNQCLMRGDCVVGMVSYDESAFVKPGGKNVVDMIESANAQTTEAAIGFCSSGASGNRPPHEEMKDWQFIKSHYYGKTNKVLKDIPPNLKWLEKRVYVVGMKLTEPFEGNGMKFKKGDLYSFGMATVQGDVKQGLKDFQVMVTNAHVMYDENCQLRPERRRKIFNGKGEFVGVLEPFRVGVECTPDVTNPSDWGVGFIRQGQMISDRDSVEGRGSLLKDEAREKLKAGKLRMLMVVFDNEKQRLQVNAKPCEVFPGGWYDSGLVPHTCPGIAGHSGAPIFSIFGDGVKSGDFDLSNQTYLSYVHSGDENSRISETHKENVMRYEPYRPDYNENYAVEVVDENGGGLFEAAIAQALSFKTYAHIKQSKSYASR